MANLSLSVFELFGSFLAGLGMFFYGVTSVGRNFKEMAGRRLHTWVALWGGHRVLAGMAGAFFAGLTQSVTPVTFVAMSMVNGGLITTGRAMPMVVWAGVGTSFMVWLSALNVKALALYLLGLAGIGLYFDRPRGSRTALGAVFGIGILFFGLQLMRSAASAVEHWPAFVATFTQMRSSSVLMFLGGAAASLVVQSMSAVSIMAMTFARAQVFSPDQTLVTIFGACFGSGIRVWVLAAGLRGTPKQLALLQCLVCGFGGLASFLIFLCARLADASIPVWADAVLPRSLESRMAAAYLAMNVFSAVAATLALPAVRRLLETWSPVSAEEDLAKPQFLHPNMLDEGRTAHELVVQEQIRLFSRFTAYFDAARARTAAGWASLETIGRANLSLHEQIEHALVELVNRHPDPGLSGRLLARLELGKTLRALEDSLRNFAERAPGEDSSVPLRTLGASMVESLDGILLTAVEACRAPGGEDTEWLLRLTDDRSEMMERVRREYLSAESGLNHDEKATLLHLTGLFERLVWLFRQVGQNLERWERLARSEG